MSWCHSPQLVVHVEQAPVLRHAHDVDDPAQARRPDLAQQTRRRGEEPFGVGAYRGVPDPGHPAHLGGDVVGQVLVEVHAAHLRPRLGQGVGGLAADALAGADDDDAPALHAQHGQVVGDRRVVRSGHRSSHTHMRRRGGGRAGRRQPVTVTDAWMLRLRS